MPQQTPEPSALDALRLSPDQNRFVYETWQTIAKNCMEARGFDYYVAPFETVDARPRLPRTADEIIVHGYNPIEDALPPAALETMAAVEGDPSYRRAYVGDELDLSDGCRDMALLVTDPPDGEYQRLDAIVEQAKIDALIEVESLPQYAELNLRWADCMSEHGHHFDKPGDALSEHVGTPVDQEQVETRVDDLNCQARTSYEQTLGQLEAEVSRDWINDNQDILAALTDEKQQYLEELSDYNMTHDVSVAPPD